MKSKKNEVLDNWEAELFDSNQTHFTIDPVELIDESDLYLRDKILPLYDSKKLEVRVAATVLTAIYQSGKRVFFISQKRLFLLCSKDPNVKQPRTAPFNGDEYDRIIRFLEKTCFRTVEESTCGIVRLPAIAELKHIEMLAAMNLKHGHLTRSEIGYRIESAYEWRRKTCEKKNLKDPSIGYFSEDIEIDVSLEDLEESESLIDSSEQKNENQIVIKLPCEATTDQPVAQEKTGWQRR